jgi:hypothetical protein
LASATSQAGATTPNLLDIAPLIGLAPVLVTFLLALGDEIGDDLEAETLTQVRRLFSFEPLRAVVLAETESQLLRDRLIRDLRWPGEAVVTIGDYRDVADALAQMQQDAPRVTSWPEGTRELVEALGLRPMRLFDAARDIDEEAAGSAELVRMAVETQLRAISDGKDPLGRYELMIRRHIEHLSQRARDLLRMMEVLHPKPSSFPDRLALALDSSLSPTDAFKRAVEERDGDEGQEDEETEAAIAEQMWAVAELVKRGLIERPFEFLSTRHALGPLTTLNQRLTVHPEKLAVIQDCLPLSNEERRDAHARAEFFYRHAIGVAISGSFASRFRMEDPSWWDNVEEWLFHLGHINPEKAAPYYATVFLDAFWWWDEYMPFDFCDRFLTYGDRPRVRAMSSKMRPVVKLLRRFRAAYPRRNAVAQLSTIAGLGAAGGLTGPPLGAVAEVRQHGERTLQLLSKLCQLLGVDWAPPIRTGEDGEAVPLPGQDHAKEHGATEAPQTEAEQDEAYHHLRGLIYLLVADAHRSRGFLLGVGPSGAQSGELVLREAANYYRRAIDHFADEGDDWDIAWMHYQLGEVISLLGEDPSELWGKSGDGAEAVTDTELYGNLERAVGDHYRSRGEIDKAAAHFGRALFYGLANQVTSNPATGADGYTQAFYAEICTASARLLLEPLVDVRSQPTTARQELLRRHALMFAEWGAGFAVDPERLENVAASLAPPFTFDALRSAIAAVSAVAFPRGPGDLELGHPDGDYYRMVRQTIMRTGSQSWLRSLGSLAGEAS